MIGPGDNDCNDILKLMMNVLNNPDLGNQPRDDAMIVRLRDTIERLRNQYDSALFAADQYLLWVRTARMLEEVKKKK